MRETLLIHLAGAPEQPCAWRRWDAGANQPSRDGRGQLEDALSDVGHARVIVLVPAERLTLTKVDLPVRQASRLLQAIPFALEDQLAEDVDKLHFATGARQSDGSTPVAVVSVEQMHSWLEPFHDAGIQPDVMMPDVLALPFEETLVTLHMEDERCLVRTGAAAGYSAPRALLSRILPTGAEAPALYLLQHEYAELPADYSVGRSAPIAQPLDAYSHFSEPTQRINLLQGAFAPRRATEKWVQAARWPAALAASCVLVSTLALALGNHQKQVEHDALQARAQEEFSQAFPQITRIVDLRVQAEQQLDRLISGGSEDVFLSLLSRSSPVLASVSELKVDGVQFRDGALYISLSGSDLQALEKLRAEFAKVNSLALDVQSAQAGTDGVQIRLKVDQA